MPRTIRFHLDENCDPRIADGLRRRGVDATTSVDAGLLEADDDVQLEYCISQSRVMVTHDADFLRFASAGKSHPGIVFGHKDRYSIGDIVRFLCLIWEVLEPVEMKDRIEWM